MRKNFKIGFIGFGEAGFHIASGLREAGISHLSAFDIHTHTPGRGEQIQERARNAVVTLYESTQQLLLNSEILLSVVTASSAVEAAEQTAPYLHTGHCYADLNSVSPETKREINGTISATGASFVEAAVMAPIPPYGHKVPMLLGGSAAQSLADLLSPFGMRFDIVSEQIGAAVAVKMCRSVIVKGLEALLLECALGAVKYGADERVFASLEESYPGMNWSSLAGYAISRIIEHGERRARELEQVAATLRAAGIEPMMAEAIVRRQDWGAQLNLKAHFCGRVPEDYRTIVHAIAEREKND
ncbi:MAG: NAD(P)-dependent oxidoreductase [Acidobacteria bacterium]|nr:NAD(P)-dependent oxidoreductase [Acidobacteriota bacterium]